MIFQIIRRILAELIIFESHYTFLGNDQLIRLNVKIFFLNVSTTQ